MCTKTRDQKMHSVVQKTEWPYIYISVQNKNSQQLIPSHRALSGSTKENSEVKEKSLYSRIFIIKLMLERE